MFLRSSFASRLNCQLSFKKRLVLMLKVITFSLQTFGGSVTAQQLPRSSAWDGLGQDPPPLPHASQRAPRPHAAPNRDQISHGLTTGPIPPQEDIRSPSWTLERSAEDDLENRKLKRATEICKGC